MTSIPQSSQQEPEKTLWEAVFEEFSKRLEAAKQAQTVEDLDVLQEEVDDAMSKTVSLYKVVKDEMSKKLAGLGAPDKLTPGERYLLSEYNRMKKEKGGMEGDYLPSNVFDRFEPKYLEECKYALRSAWRKYGEAFLSRAGKSEMSTALQMVKAIISIEHEAANRWETERAAILARAAELDTEDAGSRLEAQNG
jgi:hypothetical protein